MRDAVIVRQKSNVLDPGSGDDPRRRRQSHLTRTGYPETINSTVSIAKAILVLISPSVSRYLRDVASGGMTPRPISFVTITMSQGRLFIKALKMPSISFSRP